MAGHTDSGSPVSWLRYARADLILAETAPPTGVFLDLLCFHAQQAAEKALKAVLLFLTRESPPRTHNLRRLMMHIEQAGTAGAIPLTVEAAASLTQYAVLTRYPADLGEVDEAEWQRAVDDARAVVAWAEEILMGEPGA